MRWMAAWCAIGLAAAARTARAEALAAKELPGAGEGGTMLACEAPERVEFRKVDGYYDGHMTSLFTGPRFSFAVENHFGFWRNARLIAAVGPRVSERNVVELRFDSCLAPGDKPLPKITMPDGSEVVP